MLQDMSGFRTALELPMRSNCPPPFRSFPITENYTIFNAYFTTFNNYSIWDKLASMGNFLVFIGFAMYPLNPAFMIFSQSPAIAKEVRTMTLICLHKGGAKKRYRTFVESAIGVEMDNPLEKVFGGMILGRERKGFRRYCASRFKTLLCFRISISGGLLSIG